ncbi:MAG: bifunctional diaminohydroxyphosphoribosylaminopyrimidine deaminase/5-amino-6-(5-phosphoribosylamino)uracil reductase RibD [Bacteroidetes bacterium]|nr:bifunctional diaminohydroxyphosphoribosylaminopyrimidine deaminase/5-amino-6-(5-phosphoribosylamino)uracil reductase RibD [Bacteroidota bacterium]
MDSGPMHEFWMRRCLELAARGLGETAPNPLVACVIVQNNRIIAEGWHRQYGGPHAEVEAIQALGKNRIPPDAVVYVNLEPCAHFGKTPPCANMLLEYGVQHLVAAMEDPFPAVQGKGLSLLRQSGVNVDTGVLLEEATWLNRRFISAVTRKRPWIILKWAETADGFMAVPGGMKKQISGHAAQVLLHRWRAEEGAFLVGKNTAMHDNPLLTNRLFGSKQPLRIVVDPEQQLLPTLSIFNNDAQTWVMNKTNSSRKDNIRQLAYGNDFFGTLFEALQDEGLNSLVVEGGPDTLQRFLDAEFADEIRILRSRTQCWGKGVPAPKFEGQLLEKVSLHDDDLLIYAT